jgi:hypothetical protein
MRRTNPLVKGLAKLRPKPAIPVRRIRAVANFRQITPASEILVCP